MHKDEILQWKKERRWMKICNLNFEDFEEEKKFQELC